MWGVQQVQPLCSRRWLVRLLLQFYTLGMFHTAEACSLFFVNPEF